MILAMRSPALPCRLLTLESAEVGWVVGRPSIEIDHQTADDDTVTVRFRDSCDQVRLKCNELVATIRDWVEEGLLQPDS